MLSRMLAAVATFGASMVFAIESMCMLQQDRIFAAACLVLLATVGTLFAIGLILTMNRHQRRKQQ